MSRGTVYISGPVTGKNRKNALDDFGRAEKALTQIDYDVVNPMKLIPDDFQGDWTVAMRLCLIEMLEKCDTVYFMKDWKTSRGARIEHFLAMQLGFNILFEINTINLNLN